MNQRDICFSSLWGEAHYRLVFQRLYEEQEGQWMTPVELFSPHYSNIFADYIAKDCTMTSIPSNDDDKRKISVVELGAGRGTNALCMLSRWKEKWPSLYNRLSYTIVDSSPTLQDLQRNRLLSDGRHFDKVSFALIDLMDVAEGRIELLEEDDHIDTYALAFELFDNLPHDKVRRCPRTNTILQAELVLKETSTKDPKDLINTLHENWDAIPNNYDPVLLKEEYFPLGDPLLEQVFSSQSTRKMLKNNSQYIPTVACGLIKHFVEKRKRSRFIIADFDWLPTPQKLHSAFNRDAPDDAKGAPLITCMDDKDYSSLLDSPYLCDILFPTNFAFLAAYIKDLEKNHNLDSSSEICIEVNKQGEFLNKHGHEHIRKTQSWINGFSPLSNDFSNCSIMTMTRK